MSNFINSLNKAISKNKQSNPSDKVLVALHGAKFEDFITSIKTGGLLYPSIAVMNIDRDRKREPSLGFGSGGILMVMKNDVLFNGAKHDHSQSNTYLRTGDTYTVRAPEEVFKVNQRSINKFNQLLFGDLKVFDHDIPNSPLRNGVSSWRDIAYFALSKGAVKEAYLNSNNVSFDIVTEAIPLSSGIDKYLKKNFTRAQREELKEMYVSSEISDELAMKIHQGYCSDIYPREIFINNGFSEDEYQEMLSKSMPRNSYEAKVSIFKSIKSIEESETKTRINIEKTKQGIDKKIEELGGESKMLVWLRNKIEHLSSHKIYRTSEGEELKSDRDVERYMVKNQGTMKESVLGHNFDSISSKDTVNITSYEDLAEYRSLLNREAKNIKGEFSDKFNKEFSDFALYIKQYVSSYDKHLYYHLDREPNITKDIYLSFLAGGKGGMEQSLNRLDSNLKWPEPEIERLALMAQNCKSAYDKVPNITEYFEAILKRRVDFGDVHTFIVPEGQEEVVSGLLKEVGVDNPVVKTYNPSNRFSQMSKIPLSASLDRNLKLGTPMPKL